MKNIKYWALTAIVAMLSALTLGIGSAQAQSNDCGPAFFAVGGYPAANRVPKGWESVYTPGGVFPWENGGYNHGQDVGAANLVKKADDYNAKCPGSKIYIQGHSYGAGVVHVATMTLDQRSYAKNIHVYITGNPRHPGGVDGTWRGFQPLPGVKFRGSLPEPQNVGSFEDICKARDAICSMPPITQPIKMIDHFIGYLTGAHKYPVREAVAW